MKHRQTQPRFSLRWLVATLTLSGLVWVPSLGARAAEPIIYSVKFPAPETRIAEVEAIFPTGKRAEIELMMPIWSPGFYRVEDYASRVQSLSARTSDGRMLVVEQTQKNRWRVQTGGASTAHVSYKLLCNGRSVTTNITSLQNSPGRLKQTLEQASLDVWNSGTSGVGRDTKNLISYYVKGPVAGFLMDAKIQRVTGGRKSLDDVMRLAYKRYSGAHGFTPEQFRKTAEDVAGVDLKEWFRKAISSVEELDYTEALDWFGLRFAQATERRPDNAWRLEIRADASAAQKRALQKWLGQPAR